MLRRYSAGAALALIVGALTGFGAHGAPAQKPLPRARVDRKAVLKELTDFSVAGMSRRLGPEYAFYHKEGEEKLPDVWMRERKKEPGGRWYQIGGPWAKAAGDYSSTQGQILYAPEQPGGPMSVDRVTIIEWSNGCFTEGPEAPWWGGFRPEPRSAEWAKATNGKPGAPIAMARGMGGWSNCGVIVFSSGLLATAGTCTARATDPFLQLPPEKIPTAVSVTNKNEFALVTVHDVKQRKGQVAVIALQTNGTKTHFVHEWPHDQWCLPNVALLTGMKLLGYVDLPGIEFPTGVCAVGNHQGGRMNGRDGNAGLLREYNLAVQADRDVFLKGPNAGYASTAGFAVVTGKYENRAAFVDLQPLFQPAREMYFTSQGNWEKVSAGGTEPAQWPFAFSADPSWQPPVVKTVDVARPTAAIAGLWGAEKVRAFIASEEGKVGIYRVGGLATEAPALPEEVQRVGEVQVGRNPTCLATQKYSSDTILACSRGDREIAWIQHKGDEAKVIRRLRDSHLLDPVFVEVSDTHGIETSLLTVADFRGRKIANYRYSELVFATQGGARFGMGPEGKDEFECGGILEFPGCPFCISATNVN